MNDRLKPTHENINKEKLRRFSGDYDFGTHISLPKNLDFDKDTEVTSAIYKIVVQMQETVEKEIIDEITKAAMEQGITDLFILNKQNIIHALKKQIPKKAINDGTQFAICPECGASVNKDIEQVYNGETSYCVCCGQALDWSDNE